ncbi:MAG: hypothetical protein JO199_07995 [Candidatus Eremiobacteraeota bacterium]|nr:hypothetical protein [Candidatus Eremiobacteraeota bacterium]
MTSSGYVVLGIIFVGGAGLFALGTLIVARVRERAWKSSYAAPSHTLPSSAEAMRWTEALGAPPGELLEVADRVDMIERLAILGEPWCKDVLHDAAREERDPVVIAAVDEALNAW